jgi:GTP-binding protein
VFVDELEFSVRGGKGGRGARSFRREKYVPFGGPDGGDGGRGGDVVLRTTPHENTLFHLSGPPEYRADDGQPGGSRDKFGPSADPLILDVPIGTVVFDAEHGNVLKDLKAEGEEFVVARGGKGGRGNARFATSTNRAPRHYEDGQDGEFRQIRLSLKLIADVGLVGLPNAGKSTLLATLSRARPRIADYPFTTLEPNLGIVPVGDTGSFVMADIPGLIEGAHEGKGLGDKFLKHIERTRLLLHLVDCSDLGAEEQDPVDAWRVIRGELAGYSAELASRPTIVVATKVEDDAAFERARALRRAVGESIHAISAATRYGVPELLQDVWSRIGARPSE